MKRFLRRLLALAAAAFALPAAATSLTPHYTDLWYLPAESGWGVNIIQQHDTMFVTLFVYGPDNQPRWYVASAVRTVGASQTQFTGTLYSTMGSAFSAPWSPSALVVTEVGAITFNFTSIGAGTMTYTVNNTPVTKSIQRQTWTNQVLTGNYIGGLTAQATNCTGGVSNGPILIADFLQVDHRSPFNPVFRVDFTNAVGQDGVCTFTGNYTQEGRLGRSAGTYSCQIAGASNAPVGNFTMTDIEVSMNGITSRFTGTSQNCTWNGFFGGIKDVL
jgi:hypothetical protein